MIQKPHVFLDKLFSKFSFTLVCRNPEKRQRKLTKTGNILLGEGEIHKFKRFQFRGIIAFEKKLFLNEFLIKPFFMIENKIEITLFICLL